MTMQLKSGYTATDVEDQLRQRVEKVFTGQREGLTRLQPHGWLLPKRFLKFADKLYDFEFKKDDVIVMTWPKCGTTWMQEIIWTMRNNPNFDNPKEMIPIEIRSPFMEFDMMMTMKLMEKMSPDGPLEAFAKECPGRDPEDGVFLQFAEFAEEPRTLKLHLPFSFVSPDLLQKAKAVAVVRNPKDVCVSFHHHCKILDVHGFRGSLDEFVDFFVNDELYFSPYWPYMKEVFEKKDHPNMHLVFFEDLKANPAAELRRLDTFLGTNLTDDQISKVVDYTKFEAMQGREKTLVGLEKGEIQKADGYVREVVEADGGFFRKGEVGNYKKKLTQEQEAKIDAWTQRNSMGLHTQIKYSV